jgi:MFS family permease
VGSRKTFILGYAVTVIAFLLLIFSKSGFASLYVFAVMFSLNWGLTASEPSLVAEHFGTKSMGAIFGIMGLGYTTGASFGPIIAGRIFDLTGAYTYTFSIFAAASGLCVLLALILKPLPEKADFRG